MVETFNFGRIPDIYFGNGKYSLVPNLIKEFGKKILVVTGKSSFLQSEHWSTLQGLFELHQFQWTVTTIEKEPTPIIIDKITSIYRSANVDIVLAIGGGSVIDGGKAIAAMLKVEGSVMDYLDNFGSMMHNGQTVPFIAMPTTAGTGSETTRYAMLSEVGERGVKKMLRHSHFVPNIAIVDPNLTMTLSPFQTATGGMNTFSQLMESYVSMSANQLTDTLAFKGITYICKSLPRTYDRPSYKAGRSTIAYASMVSGVTSSNAGIGTVSGLAGAIAGKFDIPFSTLCAMLMPEVNRMTILELKKYYKENLTLAKYARIGRLLHRSRGKKDDYYREVFVKKLEQWTEHFQIPKLSHFGVTTDDFEDIILHTENQNNPMPLMDDELMEILTNCF